MISISLSLFAIIYAIATVLIFIFALLNIYHIVATGTLNLTSFSVTALVVLLMICVVVITGIFLGSADLTQNIVLLDNSSLPSL